MAKFDYDCSGWATKAKTKCYDGLTIAPNAFQECDGKVVTMVYNHDHDKLENVIGHCLLENRPGGMYCYAKFNDTDTGRTAKACVKNGDLNAFSIYANCIKKTGNTVQHGIIQEVSLVLAGCNPGALIDEVVKHGADEDYEGGEAFIYTDGGLSIAHGLDPDGEPLDDLAHSGDAATDEATQKDGKTLKEVYNSMTPEQQECCHALVGMALEKRDGEETDDEEEETVKQNVFEKDTKGTVLKHSIDEINKVVKTAKTCGTMKAAFANAGIEDSEVNALCHGIDNIDWLFPEDHLLDTPPRIIDKPDDWVSVVIGGVKHIPFSRFKSLFADLTEDDARAKGYLKGNYKTEEVFGLLRRSTGPTTVYKKQELDRDDVVDITSFDVVAWLRNEMRYKLNRELALAYILGDGRMAASRDKIDENCIAGADGEYEGEPPADEKGCREHGDRQCFAAGDGCCGKADGQSHGDGHRRRWHGRCELNADRAGRRTVSAWQAGTREHGCGSGHGGHGRGNDRNGAGHQNAGGCGYSDYRCESNRPWARA